ncbi:unnamed protein product [Tilletia controversa]|nr:unnamed protein product [Tilletia controversa]CAD6917619.1 unnamed protein product [Tilletia caries]CAD6919540.1 unnamed protein product [Tilletia controversa]CAD6928452.1 unnamed protein product [Tilletia controversa]
MSMPGMDSTQSGPTSSAGQHGLDHNRTLDEWIKTLSTLHELPAETCKANLDVLRSCIANEDDTAAGSLPLGLGEFAAGDALLSALVRLIRTLLQEQAGSQSTIRATTSAIRAVIALIAHGSPVLLRENQRRVHELSSLCLTVFQWVTPTSSLRSQSSTSSLSQLRRPISQTSVNLQQTGALAFGSQVPRQPRSKESGSGSGSRSSSISSWRASTSNGGPNGVVPSSPTKPAAPSFSQVESSLLVSPALQRSASELDSEESANESRKGTQTSTSGDPRRASKYYCISCLSHINAREPRLLFQEWPEIFGLPKSALRNRNVVNVLHMTRSEQPLSVRTAAVQLCESALQQAGKEGLMIVIEDRPQRPSAFTSLAVRTGSVVSDIRDCLAAILNAPSSGTHTSDNSPNLTMAALKAARALFSATPNVAYKQRSATILTPPVISLCSSTDSATAAAAFSILSELMSASRNDPSVSELLPLDSILAQLSQSDTRLSVVRTQAWKALESLVGRDLSSVSPQTQRIAELCLQSLRQSPADLERQAAISALASLLQSRATHELGALQADNSSALQGALEAMIEGSKDASPLVRCSATDCVLPLAAAGCAQLARDSLTRLLKDSEAAVCAAACRAIGVAFDAGYAAAALLVGRSEDDTAATRDALMIGFSLLHSGCFDTEQQQKASCAPLRSSAMIVAMRASWAFATMCDRSAEAVSALNPDEATRGELLPLLRAAQDLCTADDRVAANGLRAMGALLRMIPCRTRSSDSAEQDQVLAALPTLLRALRQGKDPKTRWNAGSALERAFLNFDLVASLLYRDRPGGLTLAALVDEIATAACSDKMFKVKLTALQALNQLCLAGTSSSSFASRTDSVSVASGIHAAMALQWSKLVATRDDLEVRAESAAFKERQLHVDPCRKAVEALLAAIVTVQSSKGS